MLDIKIVKHYCAFVQGVLYRGYSGGLGSTCFEGELILLLSFVVIQCADTDPCGLLWFPHASVVFEGVSVAAIFIARIPGRLLVVRPLGGIGLVLFVAAHAAMAENIPESDLMVSGVMFK